jgi:hypothetical protein
MALQSIPAAAQRVQKGEVLYPAWKPVDGRHGARKTPLAEKEI